MKLSAGDLDRKVRQHDADILAVYGLLGALRETQDVHSSRFDGVEGRLTSVESKLDALGTQVHTHGSKLDALGSQVDALGSQVETLRSDVTAILDLLRSA
ncbi:hypothetical protein [Nocardioides sp.]|uniref:hypothetical protein n=1 Tax=Nocardioides sp. TaxID=35761 RepID=UPI003D0E8D7F